MAYGVCVESNLDFCELPRVTGSKDAIQIQVERVTSIKADPGISVRSCVAQGRTVHIVSHVSYVNVQIDLALGFELWVSSRCIYCLALNGVPENLLKYWILQQIIPLFLLLCGSTEFLHGMAVSVTSYRKGQRNLPCMGFVGPSYAGKSTLLNYFLSQGHALVADDQLALSRHNYAEIAPTVPFYRPYRAAEELGILTARYSWEVRHLSRLYFLVPCAPEAETRIEKISGIDAVTALFHNIQYGLHNLARPDFFPLVESRFRGIADISRRIPAARLHVPRNLDRLPEVYDLIQNDHVS